MKLTLCFGVAALFLLSGCDNFVLLKQTGKNDPRLFKTETNGIPTVIEGGPSAPPSQGKADQVDPKPGAMSGLPEVNPIENKAAPIPENRPEETASAQTGAPVGKPAIVKVQPEASVNLPEQAKPAQPAAPEVRAQAPQQQQAQPATQQAAPAQHAQTQPSQQRPETVRKADESQAAEATTTSEQAAKPTDAAPTQAITLNEYINFSNVISSTVQEDVVKNLIRTVPASNVKASDIKFEASGDFRNLNLKISAGEQAIAELKELKINLTDANVISQSGFEIFGLCSGAKCEILFIAAMKLDQGRRIVENYPVILKKVNGSYVTGVLKTPDEYSAERNAPGANRSLKLVPQLKTVQQLQEHIEAHGDKLIAMINNRLKADETLAYTDLILFGNKVRTDKFSPRFSRENNQLILTARVEYQGPLKPSEFKVQVKSEGASQPATSETGLSLTAVALVKEQIFVILLDQTPYTSKIKSVNKAMQASLCSLVEEETEQFTKCIPVGASIVFNDQKVVEGNAKEKISE